jgi:hypothetical protein
MTADWDHERVRSWVQRHGGNVTALARRLRVGRTELQAWMADPLVTSRARVLPPRVQAHMVTIDELEELRLRLSDQ